MLRKKSLFRFLREETGGVVAEYAILISGIAAVVLATVYLIGLSVRVFYDSFSQGFH
ncbi:MAG: Flp family type IVb pilin [Thermodesulfobacteriota bacterium]